MRPPKIDESTEEERRQFIRNTFKCIADCDMWVMHHISGKRSGSCLLGLY